MLTHPIRFDNLKTTTKLFRDLIYHDGSLISLIGPDFRNLDSIRETSEKLLKSNHDRKLVCSVLAEQNRAFEADSTTFENINLLRDRQALCIVAGHQVMLLGGQTMVFLKAITLLKLAERLEQELSHPVVPVFWLATDDHDFDEVSRLEVPLGNGAHETITYSPSTSVANLPMSDVVLDENITPFLNDVFSRLQETEFKQGLRDQVESWYRPGESIFGAFAKCMSALFEDRGLILVNPADPRLRRLSAGVFAREIMDRDRIREILKESNTALLKSGYHVQVTRDASLSNLFMVDGFRRKIAKAGDEFTVEGSAKLYSTEELLAAIETHPEKFSPNVFLRPLVQSELLPALAFVGGPAEIAYFAQMRELFGHFGIVPPVMFPRISATMLDPKWSKFLEQRSLDLARMQTMDDREAYLTELLKDSFPTETDASFAQVRESISSRLNELKALVGDDDGLQKTLAKLSGRIDFEIGNFGEKLFKSHRKLQSGFVEKYRELAEYLFPEQTLQERYYCFMYWVNKYGPGMVDRLIDELSIDTFEHQMVQL